MSKLNNHLIKIHVPSMCFTEQLGEEFELIATPELEKAILTINEACSKRVYDLENYVFTQFLINQKDKIVDAVNKGDNRRYIGYMLKIANYQRKDKLELKI